MKFTAKSTTVQYEDMKLETVEPSFEIGIGEFLTSVIKLTKEGLIKDIVKDVMAAKTAVNTFRQATRQPIVETDSVTEFSFQVGQTLVSPRGRRWKVISSSEELVMLVNTGTNQVDRRSPESLRFWKSQA